MFRMQAFSMDASRTTDCWTGFWMNVLRMMFPGRTFPGGTWSGWMFSGWIFPGWTWSGWMWSGWMFPECFLDECFLDECVLDECFLDECFLDECYVNGGVWTPGREQRERELVCTMWKTLYLETSLRKMKYRMPRGTLTTKIHQNLGLEIWESEKWTETKKSNF